MAAFVLPHGSALQSLESHCHVRERCRIEDPHSPVAMCNPALRSTAPATMVISIRKETRMQIQSPWTLDSIPLSQKRCRKLLWHKLSPVDPSKFPPTPFIGIDLAITSVNTADGCVPFRELSRQKPHKFKRGKCHVAERWDCLATRLRGILSMCINT